MMVHEGHTAGPRWAGAGHSNEAEPELAGRDAVAAALGGPDARLVVVFAYSGYQLEPLMAAARDAAGGAALIGCSTAAVIAAGASANAGVAAFALGGSGFEVATASTDMPEAGDLRAAGADVAGCVEPTRLSPHRALVLISDRRGGDPDDAVRGAYAAAGP